MSQVTLVLLALCIFGVAFTMAAPQYGSGISLPTEFPSSISNGIPSIGSGPKLPNQFDYPSLMKYQEQLNKFMQQQYSSYTNIDNIQ